MTTPKDSQAVVEANKILGSDTATAADFHAAWRSIVDELRRLDAAPRLEPGMATSLAERHSLDAQREVLSTQREVYTRLAGRLRDAESRAKAREAINGAEDARQALEKALEAAQQARQEADKLAGEALDQARSIVAARSAAGPSGRGKVGASSESLARLAELAGGLVNDVELKRVTNRAELEG